MSEKRTQTFNSKFTFAITIIYFVSVFGGINMIILGLFQKSVIFLSLFDGGGEISKIFVTFLRSLDTGKLIKFILGNNIQFKSKFRRKIIKSKVKSYHYKRLKIKLI